MTDAANAGYDRMPEPDALDAVGNPDDLEGLPNLARLEQVIREQGEDAVEAHLVLDAAADISGVVGEQMEEALYVLQTAMQNFIAAMALMNKYHELAYHHGGQEGEVA